MKVLSNSRNAVQCMNAMSSRNHMSHLIWAALTCANVLKIKIAVIPDWQQRERSLSLSTLTPANSASCRCWSRRVHASHFHSLHLFCTSREKLLALLTCSRPPSLTVVGPTASITMNPKSFHLCGKDTG